MSREVTYFIVILAFFFLPTALAFGKMQPDQAEVLMLELIENTRKDCKRLTDGFLQAVGAYEPNEITSSPSLETHSATSGGMGCTIHQRGSDDMGGLFAFLPLFFWCLYRRKQLT